MNNLSVGGMQFERPLLLALYLLIPGLIALYVRNQRRKRADAMRFSAVDLLSSPPAPRRRRHLPFSFLVAATVLLVTAAGDPSVPGSVFSMKRQVIVVLDVSKSMEAKDVAPTRIDAAKQGATRFINSLPEGYEVGLVAFSDLARVVSTPTMNRTYLNGQIDNLTTENGTSTGDALLLALGLLGEDTEGGVVVLLSDGRQTSGMASVESAAGALKGAGVTVYAIALGTDQGMISVIDPNLNELMNIEVPPDLEALELLTFITGGKAFAAVTIDELNTIYDSVGGSIKPRAGLVSASWILVLGSLVLLAGAGLAQSRLGRLR